MKNIVVVGAKGKMGSLVCKLLKEHSDYTVLEIDKDDDLNNVVSADMIIDFANASSSVKSAKYAVENHIPLIVGATGQSEEQESAILKAGKQIAVLKCANFSIGIAKVKELLKKVLALKIEDVVVFEKHHRLKKDSPSGTALELKKSIEQDFDGKIQMLSERGGQEIGTHQIDFYFGSELISIKHQAFSREAFAEGVCFAVGKMLNKTRGVYSFDKFVQNEQIKI